MHAWLLPAENQAKNSTPIIHPDRDKETESVQHIGNLQQIDFTCRESGKKCDRMVDMLPKKAPTQTSSTRNDVKTCWHQRKD